MSQQKQVIKNQANKKRQPSVEPSIVSEPTAEFAGVSSLTNGLTAASSDNPVENQMTARLSDPRIPAVQRRALAGQIGDIQGNGHLQRLIASSKRGAAAKVVVAQNHNGHSANGSATIRPPLISKKSSNGSHSGVARKTDGAEAAGPDLSEESLGGGNSTPNLTPAEPPTNGAAPAPLIQCREQEADKQPTEAEKAAALAAAKAAKQAAAQTAASANNEVAKSNTEKATEQQAGEAAKQKAEQAKGKGAAQSPEKGGGAAPVEAAGKEEPTPGGAVGLAPAASGNGAKAATEGAEKAPASPEQDPAFQGVVQNIKGVAQEKKTHAPAKAKAAEAQAAAESPASETEAKAQANQVGEMQQAETPGFNAPAFKAKLKQRIQELAPKTPSDADEFKDSGKLSGVKDEATVQAAEEKAASKAPMEAAAAKAPDTGSVEPKPVTPLTPPQPGAPPPNLGAEAAAPKAKTGAEVQTPFRENSQAMDQQMAEADVTEEQLANSNEPEFQGALSAKKEAQADAAAAPQTYRQTEQGQLAQAEGEAATVAQEKTQAMHGDRAALLNQVGGQQEQTKSKDEQERQKVAADIQKIYDETKSNVERILSELDGKVEKAFDEGATAAKQAFEDYVEKQMDAYKEERYGGWLGWAQWLDDKWSGLPAEVNVFYQQGRQLFIQKMDAVIDNVVSIIQRGLDEAKAEIANGKQHIQTYVAGLSPSLRQVGQQAAQEMQGKFSELEESVDNKQNELIDTLAQKYQEKLQAVDARIEELKEANKGLKDKVIDAVAGVIKTIMELKDMLLNVLARAAEAIGKIIRDPIGFLGNLIDGIKLGFNNFVGNIETHLKQGLIGWLTGSIAGAGITLPETFDLKGIFQLVMQILGLSFDQIMKRVADALGFDIRAFIGPIMEIIDLYKAEGLVGLAKAGLTKVIGQERMEALMKVWDIFQIVMSGDFGQLWGMLQEYLGDLKAMVMDKIQEFISERVIKAGITWLLSLFNPAGAFIKACKMIYDVVMFFVERGSQIMSLVNTIIDSVSNIANGNVAGAAKYIEESLAKAIPVAISFLSSLLGLGNVSEKVQEIIQSVRGMIEKALDAVFNSGPVKMVAGFIKKVVGKVKGLVKAGVEKVKGWAKAGVKKVKGALGFGEKEPSPEDAQKNEQVKTLALNEVQNRAKQEKPSLQAFSIILDQVYQEYEPQGLKSLKVKGKEETGKVSIFAEASPVESADIGWDEVQVVKLSPEEYQEALSMAHPVEYLSDIDRFIDTVAQQAAQIAAGESEFVDLCKNKKWNLAGTRFHNIAKDVVNEMVAKTSGDIPPGYKPQAEFTVTKGKGGSRLDLFIEDPNGELIEIDWKTTGKSAMSYGVRKKEMPKHEKHVQQELQKKLKRQESRSWVAYVRPLLAGENIEWPGY